MCLYSAAVRGGSMRIRRPGSASQPPGPRQNIFPPPPASTTRTYSVSNPRSSSSTGRSPYNTIGPTGGTGPIRSAIPPELLNLKQESRQWPSDCKCPIVQCISDNVKN